MSKKILLTSFIFLSLFFVYSCLVAKELFTSLDFDTTVRLQDNLPRMVDLPFSVLSVIGSAEASGAFWLLVIALLLWKKYYFAALAFLTYPLGLFIELMGKLMITHPSPPHLFYRGVINFDLPSSYVQTGFSYPSGHVFRTTYLVTFILVWAYLNFKFRSIYLYLTLGIFLLLMLLSRVYLGEHWTTDVIGGFLLGIGTGLLPASVLVKYNRTNNRHVNSA